MKRRRQQPLVCLFKAIAKEKEEKKGLLFIHTYRVDYDERKWICSFLFLILIYTYTYILIYIYMHMPMRWKERERCSVRKRPWFRRSLEVVTRLLIAQKEQPTCMCVCDNDTVKINKTM